MTRKFIIPYNGIIKKKDRSKLNNQKSTIIWFTGLSCSGKSTLAYKVEERLFLRELLTYVLDGDNIRAGLNNNLDFSAEGRQENIRRIGEVAKLFVDAGIIVMAAFISPYERDREKVRSIVEEKEFVEVYVRCPLSVCENRDTKGLYKKAREGIIKKFTGIDAPYEKPENPEIIIDTDKLSIKESVDKIIYYLEKNGYIKPKKSCPQQKTEKITI